MAKAKTNKVEEEVVDIMGGMDFAGDVDDVDVQVELGWGNAGVQLKDFIKGDGDDAYLVFGLGKHESEYHADGSFNLKSPTLQKYVMTEMWLNTEDLTPDAAVAQGYDGKKHFNFSTAFFDSQRHLPGDKEWYRDLGYSYSKTHEASQLEDGTFTVQSFLAKRGGSTWFDGKSVVPQMFYYVPVMLVEIEGKGRDRTITPTKSILLKLKAGTSRAQGASFMNKVESLSEGDDPNVYGRIIKVTRDGNFWNFDVSPITIPEEDFEMYDEQLDQLKDKFASTFKGFFTTRHGGHPMLYKNPESYIASNDAVRNYLVSITNVDTWDEFVKMYSIKSTPFDDSDYEEVPAFAAGLEGEDDIPF